MIKKLIYTLILSAAALTAQAVTPASAFTDAPASVLPTLDRMTRLDMLDYFNSGSPKPSKNSFKSDCRILALSDSQVTFSTSDVSEVELSLIPMKGDTVIMMITTLKTPGDDSTARFYTKEWKEIEKGLFLVPLLDDWVRPEAAQRKEELADIIPFMLARFTYEPASQTLTVTNNVAGILPEEATSWAGDALHSKLVYRWNGKKMVKVADRR